MSLECYTINGNKLSFRLLMCALCSLWLRIFTTKDTKNVQKGRQPICPRLRYIVPEKRPSPQPPNSDNYVEIWTVPNTTAQWEDS